MAAARSTGIAPTIPGAAATMPGMRPMPGTHPMRGRPVPSLPMPTRPRAAADSIPPVTFGPPSSVATVRRKLTLSDADAQRQGQTSERIRAAVITMFGLAVCGVVVLASMVRTTPGHGRFSEGSALQQMVGEPAAAELPPIAATAIAAQGVAAPDPAVAPPVVNVAVVPSTTSAQTAAAPTQKKLASPRRTR